MTGNAKNVFFRVFKEKVSSRSLLQLMVGLCKHFDSKGNAIGVKFETDRSNKL